MKGWWGKIRLPVLTLAGFGLVVVALMIGGVMPLDGLKALFLGAFGSPAGWRETLIRATPLLFLGSAVYLALRAGLFNIGADGQFVVGALAGTAVVLKFPGPVGMVGAVVIGAVAGGLWAFPAGWIKAYRGGHEVITTIMLNNIGAFMTLWVVNGMMKDPARQSPTTVRLPKESWLPQLVDAAPFRLNAALVLAAASVVGLWWWLSKTTKGFELKAVGGNATAAETAGIDAKAITLQAMVVSGMIAGLAGAVQVMAYDKRFFDGISPGYGFDALGVALLAGNSPLGIVLSGLAFAALGTGTTELSLLGVPKGLNGVLLAVLIVVFAAIRYRKEVVRDS